MGINVLQLGDRRIVLEQGDITTIHVDAIVNAANSSLLGGGGVDGAIHRAGGPAILEACRDIRARQGKCAPGRAVATTAGKLPATYVIHTVGPVYQNGRRGEAATLARAYTSSLQLAETLKVTSLAFPSISTGAYRFPLEEAATVALKAVHSFLDSRAEFIEVVKMVLYSSVAERVYADALASLRDEA